MYVCICKGITEEKLKSLAKSGHSNKEVLKKLGVGDDCGVCILTALEKLGRHSKNENSKK